MTGAGKKRMQPETPYWRTLKDAEKSMILFALKNSNGNVVAAAAALGVHYAVIYRRCREFQIGPFAPGVPPKPSKLTRKAQPANDKKVAKGRKGKKAERTVTPSALVRTPSVNVTVDPNNHAIPLAPAGPLNPDQFSFPLVGSGSRRGRARPGVGGTTAEEPEDDETEDVEDVEDGDDEADEDEDEDIEDEDADDGDADDDASTDE